MALMRWDPMDVDRFREDINRYWNRFREDWNLDQSRPRTRIHQGDDAFWVDFELPGVNPDEVDIEVDNDSITVSGAFPGSPINQTEQETFHSSIGLPTEVDPETAEAEFHHGLLRVQVRRANGKRRHIPIKSMS